MTTLRAIGHFAGALALAVALAGCGDGGDGETPAADDTGSVADQSADVSEDADDAADQDGGDDAGSGGAGSGSESGDSGDAGDGSDGDSGSGESGATVPGVYQDYSADAVADTSYDTTILFFHASWCPECRAFEQAILDEGVPDGVQILKTDYDTEQDLKDRYGVNHQSWFVKVDSDGDAMSDWLGYGEDKSVDTILEQLG